MSTDTVRPAAYAAFLRFDDTTSVLEVAETIAAAQRAANTVDATAPSGDGVWGQLHGALLAALAIHFRNEHGENAAAARNAADAVLTAMYENGETVAYNVRLAESHLYG